MEAITPSPWQHLHSSSLHRSPLTSKPPRRSSSCSCPVNIAETDSEPSFSVYSLKSSLPNHSLSDSASCLMELQDVKSLNSVKVMHAQIIKLSNKRNIGLKVECLITSYLEFCDFQSASMVFFVGLERNNLYWNYFLKEFRSFGGDPCEILEVFGDLHRKHLRFDSRILTLVLKICTNLMDVWFGLEVHSYLIKAGLDTDAYSQCALMNFYGRCLGIEIAYPQTPLPPNKKLETTTNQGVYGTNHGSLIHKNPNLEILLWNEAVLVSLRNGRWLRALQLFHEMQFSLVKAKSFTITRVLQACAKLEAFDEGKQIHGYVLRSSLESNLLIWNALISLYSKNCNLEKARTVFDSMGMRDLSSWNSIISGYAALGYLDKAWNLFDEMQSSGLNPDNVTWNCLLNGHFRHGLYHDVITIVRKMQLSGVRPNSGAITGVLQAIGELGFLNFGEEAHAFVIRNGLEHDVYVGTSLIDMYVKNDDLTRARAVFDSVKNRNVFSWNSLMSGYSYKGCFEDAMDLLNQMKNEGIEPDLVTYNALVSGYSIWGHKEEALAMLDEIKIAGFTPNVVSWTALISGCSQRGNHKEALDFCIQMLKEGVKPNSTTISSLLRACSGLAWLQKGKEMHCLSIRNDFTEDGFVTTALIDMYSKCGSLKSAYDVFHRIGNKTSASWNSMILGFSIHGLGTEAISFFNKMQKAGMKPDAITFTALLSACKNSGLVKQGWKYFDSMNGDYGVAATIEHYSCMVDLLGKAGYLDEAWDFIQKMPVTPDATIWGALLMSCRTHENLELAEIAATNLFKLEPYNSANYALMMNLYATLDRWNDKERIKDTMDLKGIKCGKVWSWIQIKQTVHVFSAVGRAHPDEGEIYFELYQLVSEMKKHGYRPETTCVHQKIGEEEKEKVLLGHTAKLAMIYGLIKTETGAPIRVVKNTRLCSDCHTAAKYVSLFKSREIHIKDGARFHYFLKGKCSCNDFW